MSDPAATATENGGADIEVLRDFYERLVKSKVYGTKEEAMQLETNSGDESSEPSKNIKLSTSQKELFENGITLGKYMLVLKERMVN